MKRTNLAKKLTAMVMTGAMVMSMGMTAFAAGPITKNEDGTVTLTKKVKYDATNPGKVAFPAATFSFTVTPATDVTTSTTTMDGYVVYAGEEGGAYFATGNNTITFTPNGEYTFDAINNTIEDTTTISFDTTKFKKPGVYRYVVSEGSVNTDGVTKDSDTYYLDVYVINGTTSGTYEVKYVVAFKGTESATSKSDLIFTNNYDTEEVTIKKIITGNQGDKTEEFKFSILVTSGGAADGSTVANSNETYKAEIFKEGQSNPIPVTFSSGVISESVELGDNDYIVIYGLSENDTYEIYEMVAGADGYTTSYYDGISTENEETTDVCIGTVNAGGTASSVKVETPENGNTADRDVLVDNNKAATTPTGIAMTFAPYALMVAFAGVFAVMFLRKKREDF